MYHWKPHQKVKTRMHLVFAGTTILMYLHMYVSTVVWEKFGVKKFRQMPGTTKIKHTKIFLPQRNGAVYNGLWPA